MKITITRRLHCIYLILLVKVSQVLRFVDQTNNALDSFAAVWNDLARGQIETKVTSVTELQSERSRCSQAVGVVRTRPRSNI